MAIDAICWEEFLAENYENIYSLPVTVVVVVAVALVIAVVVVVVDVVVPGWMTEIMVVDKEWTD